MLILAIDTSGKQGSITLARGDERSFEVLDTRAIAGGTFSAQLIPQIAAALGALKLSKKDIQGIAVTAGPGSFTGLRVGLTAAKGLAEVLGTPIVAVSLLHAIAIASAQMLAGAGTCVLYTALDAGRSEVFWGEYRAGTGIPIPVFQTEQLISLADLVARVDRDGHGLPIDTPDQTLIESLKRRVRDPYLLATFLVERPTSADIAHIGLRRILTGQTVSVEELDANYLRRSDAEIFAKPQPPSKP
jgi:tRNA threonylcarbamoyladenosine biosynthesis protein TsaB